MPAIGLKSAIGAKHGFRPRSCPAMARLVSEIGAWAGLIDSASKPAGHSLPREQRLPDVIGKNP
jgi:hypothetical protein